MRFKETIQYLSNNRTNYKTGTTFPASKLGAYKFPRNIFQLDERTPHWEMREVLEIIETRPQVNSGLKQIARFIIGDKIEVDSEDKNTINYMNNWLKKRSVKSKIFDLTFIAIGLGNSFIEPLYRMKGDKLIFDNFNILPDPSRVYINLSNSMNEKEDYWIFEIPIETKFLDGKQPQYYKMNYVKGSALFKQSVYGIGYSKNHLCHLKIGWSRDGYYGRGFLSSTIDDNNILREILKNIALIARYRALNTKLITPAIEGEELIEDDVEEIEQKLLNKRDEDHLVLNKKLQVDSLSNTNEYDTMNNEIDFLRRDINSGLVPNFITPWDNDVNRATAGESKIPFMLELDSLREEIVEFLNKSILDKLRAQGEPIAEDASFKFGIVDMESYDTRLSNGLMLYQNGVISFNEFREMIDLETLNGGDKFNWEMTDADGNSMFIGKKPQQLNPKISAKLKEEYYHLPQRKKPRTKVCGNCVHYKPLKRFCGLNSWPVEASDGCNRFEKKEDEKTE